MPESEDRLTGCVCDAPGYCARHGAMKRDRHYKLCRESKEHFDAWEQDAMRRGLIAQVSIPAPQPGVILGPVPTSEVIPDPVLEPEVAEAIAKMSIPLEDLEDVIGEIPLFEDGADGAVDDSV